MVSVPKHKKHPPAGVKATTRTRVSTPAQRLLEMPHALIKHRQDPRPSGLDIYAAVCSRQHLLLTPLQLLIYPCVLLHGFVPDMSPCTVIPCSVMQTLYVQACLPSTAQVFHCRSCGLSKRMPKSSAKGKKSRSWTGATPL